MTVLDPFSSSFPSGLSPSVPPRGSSVLWATIMAHLDHRWMSPFLLAALAFACPPPGADTRGGGAQPVPPTVILAGIPTSAGVGTPLPRANCGVEKDHLGSKSCVRVTGIHR